MFTVKGRMDKAFEHQMDSSREGEPPTHSMVRAYLLKKKQQMMAEGGLLENDMPKEGSLAIAYGMKKKAKKMAEGGDIKGVHTSEFDEVDKRKYPSLSMGDSDAGEMARNEKMDQAKAEHHRVLGEMVSMRKKDRTNLAEGGPACGPNCPGCEMCHGGMMAEGGMADGLDMIKRIMRKRMSEGGKVANQDLPIVDDMNAEYDELHKDDDLEFHDTGANSGDEIGDEDQDASDRDVVARIMRSRAKKDRMPRPA
jgi:hypothetical protein